MGVRNTGQPVWPGWLALRVRANGISRQPEVSVTARNSGGNPSETVTGVVEIDGMRGVQPELAVVRYLVTHQAPRYHGPLWTTTWGTPGVNLEDILVALVRSLPKIGRADGGAPSRLIEVGLVAVIDPVAAPGPLRRRAGASI